MNVNYGILDRERLDGLVRNLLTTEHKSPSCVPQTQSNVKVISSLKAKANTQLKFTYNIVARKFLILKHKFRDFVPPRAH